VSDSVEKDPLPVNDGILRQVRTSQNAQDTVRVVLDLASIKSYAAFPLHEPERLVVDVTGRASDEEGDENDTVPPAPAVTPAVPDLPASTETKENPPPVVANGGSGKGRDGKLSLSRQLGLRSGPSPSTPGTAERTPVPSARAG